LNEDMTRNDLLKMGMRQELLATSGIQGIGFAGVSRIIQDFIISRLRLQSKSRIAIEAGHFDLVKQPIPAAKNLLNKKQNRLIVHKDGKAGNTEFLSSLNKFQRNSLELGFAIGSRLCDQIVSYYVLVGDLGIPPGDRYETVRLVIDKLTPANREIVAISEAIARNHGKRRLLDHYLKGDLLRGSDSSRIISIDSQIELQIINDQSRFSILLRRASGAPTCELIVAGKVYFLEKRNIDLIISLYSEFTDPEIEKKLVNGYLAYRFLRSKSGVRIILLIEKEADWNKINVFF
jgi:hypothetical protein